MPVRKWVAVIALSVAMNGPLHGGAGGTRVPEHAAAGCIARGDRAPAPAAPRGAGEGADANADARIQARRRRSSTATKVTAAVALGLVGFWVGAVHRLCFANATGAPGDGRTAAYTSGVIGAGAGAGLGVWLASR